MWRLSLRVVVVMRVIVFLFLFMFILMNIFMNIPTSNIRLEVSDVRRLLSFRELYFNPLA